MSERQWLLEAVEGNLVGRRIPITERGITVGRESDNSLVLLDDNISRHHAIIRMSGQTALLEDRNSRNGTFVNNVKVGRVDLKEGDRIALGSHLFVARCEDASTLPDVPIDPERTVIHPSTPAQLRRTQAIQIVGTDGQFLSGAPSGPEPPPPPPWPSTEKENGRPFRTDLAGGPIFGGAAAPSFEPQAARPTQDFVPAPAPAPAPEFAPPPPAAPTPVLPLPSAAEVPAYVPPPPFPDADPFPMPVAKQSKKTGLYAIGGAAVVLIVGMAVYSSTTGSSSSEGDASQAEVSAVTPKPNRIDTLFVGSGAAGQEKAAPLLTPEEEALPPEQKMTLAKSYLDQAQLDMDNGALPQALTQYRKAWALDPSCKLCSIRIPKLEAEIKKLLERYKSDALRAYQAMEYQQAKQNWERVLQLETDLEGQRIAREGLQNAITQIKQQSFR